MYHYLVILRSSNPEELPPEEFIVMYTKTFTKDFGHVFAGFNSIFKTKLIPEIQQNFPKFTGDPKTTIIQIQPLDKILDKIEGKGDIDCEYTTIIWDRHIHLYES